MDTAHNVRVSDSMPPLDVLVVGVGRWGERHLATLKEMQDDEEIGKLYAFDIDDSRKEAATHHGAIWSANIRRAGMAARQSLSLFEGLIVIFSFWHHLSSRWPKP